MYRQAKQNIYMVHCMQSASCTAIRKMRPKYYCINVAALALAVVAAAVYNASFFRNDKFTKDAHPSQHSRQSLNVHTADATLELMHSDETDVFTQEHAAQTLEYDGVVWKTPKFSTISRIRNAQITTDGLVSNATDIYTFDKWYWRQASAKHVRMSRPTHVENHAFLSLVQIYNECFQHIVFDTLPKVAFACRFMQSRPDITVLVMNNLHRDLVAEYCRIDKSHFMILKSPLHATDIFVPHFVGQDLQMGMIPANSMKTLGSQNTTGSRVVYVARKAGTIRSISNEASVLAALREIFPGLVVIFPTNNWRQDRGVFAEASIIIGPHGGGMANMIFAPVNTTIIEFLPLRTLKRQGANSRPCYFGLAHGLGFRYFSVEPEGFGFDKTMHVSIRMLVDTVHAAKLSVELANQ